jgi:hypothetical protein
MPTEQSQVEYYHYYRASQRRVQQWVQNTSRELEAGTTAGRSSNLPHLVVGEAEGGGNSSGGSRRRGSQRRSSSPSSKRQVVDSSRSRGPSSRSRSTRKKAKTKTNNNLRYRKPYSSDGLTTSSLLVSLGLFPLIFVLTPQSVATLFSATILLAGYFSLDYRASIHIFLFVSYADIFHFFQKKESISEKL